MKLIFELPKSKPGDYIAAPEKDASDYLDTSLLRPSAPLLPHLSENDVSRHYTALARRCYGVNSGFYPLGSCTMKYNPKCALAAASMDGFCKLHPTQNADSVQGALSLLYQTQEMLCEICGMDAFSLQPAAGAHGELAGLLLIRAYHESRSDAKRTKILVPDSAHGTNPASAAMAGFTVVNIPSLPDGGVDLDKLAAALDDTVAGLMLTNPNTVGIFDANILKITALVHEAGALCYYDGANLNAIMGIARPGDMGFDVMHVNLHKTFATPHGGGGPGSGPVGVRAHLIPFLPAPIVKKSGSVYDFVTPARSIGRVKAFFGNFLVVVKAYCYMTLLGAEGLKEASETAVLNANYLLSLLADHFHAPFGRRCMHEFVLCLQPLKDKTGVSALDFAKGLIDRGMHPPTMYFPLIVHEALMPEPTETENKQTLDDAAAIFLDLIKTAKQDPAALHEAPHLGFASIRRPDEVRAARSPKLRYHAE